MRFCLYRILVLTMAIVMPIGGGLFVGIQVIPGWLDQHFTEVICTAMAVAGILFAREALHIWLYLRAVWSLDDALTSFKPDTVLKVSTVRRLVDVAVPGTLVLLALQSQFRVGGDVVTQVSSTIWLVVVWVCHCLTVVSRVESDGRNMIFHMLIGRISVPLHLLKRVIPTAGSGYFLRFRFSVGSIHTLNPAYPARNTAAIPDTLRQWQR